MRAAKDSRLRATRTWLVTGAAGFIGSHLVERLLREGQRVVGLDNLLTGKRENLLDVLARVPASAAEAFRFIEGDVRDAKACREACDGVEFVLHQAGLGSVPRSIEDPFTAHEINVDGTLRILLAAREAGTARVVFASSSSVYGDQPDAFKTEAAIGDACSPYALTKRIDELYARLFASLYGLECIGLRYFNVFGPRQDPAGPYAAVIPRWIDALLCGAPCVIFGDGETSRDFCYVDNVVQANLLAALAPARSEAVNQIYNVGAAGSTTLKQLFAMLRDRLAERAVSLAIPAPRYEPFRTGDVRQSCADIGKARRLLGYAPVHSIESGLEATIAWHLERRAPPPGDREAALVIH